MSGRKSKFNLGNLSSWTQNRLFREMKRQRLNEDSDEERINDVNPVIDDRQNSHRTSNDSDFEVEFRNDPQTPHSSEHDSSSHHDQRSNDENYLDDEDVLSNEGGDQNGLEYDNESAVGNDELLNVGAENDEEDEWFSSNDEDVSDEPLDDDEFQNDEENDQAPDLEEDPLLFAGAPLTLGESLTCILTFAMRFALTGVALDALLKLISIHCPRPNVCKRSLYLFKKHFAAVNIPLQRRFYCSTCYSNLDTEDSACENCRDNDVTPEDVAYFIEIPLLDQLETLYRRPGFFDLLQRRFQRDKQNLNNYEDIYDGKIYKEFLEQQNAPAHQNNISFSWNTDGVALFKSSGCGFWPFYLCINELPYIHRSRKENLLLVGLWYGPKKPLPSLFLDGISEDLNHIKNGVNLKIPNHDDPIRVHGEVVCGTCDLPAKALFLNMKQYNGKYGCQKCLIKSEPFSEESSTPRIYPFKASLELRTQEQTDNFATEALAAPDDVFGVKGPSVLSRLSKSYIRTTAVDSMHCVFLGVVRALLVLWFQDGSGLLSHFAGVVDKEVCSITPPHFVSRLPRTIIENIMYLKAQELKTWFFYYSMPILHTIMSEVYLEHYSLFVYSMYTLHRASISEENVILAEKLLTEFVSRYCDLYGRINMTANLHQLLHLPQNVREFGPLWTTSCFPFENANGVLKTLVTGTKFGNLQICAGISLFMNLPEIEKKLVPDSPPFNFCEMLSGKKKSTKVIQLLMIYQL